MPTADELMELARACADRLDLTDHRRLPALEDVEDAAQDEYEALLDVLQEDEVFGGVNLERQQTLAETIQSKLPEADRAQVEELADQHTRHVWLMQEAAFHVGLAIGLKLAGGRHTK
jgi:hypothetical protein